MGRWACSWATMEETIETPRPAPTRWQIAEAELVLSEVAPTSLPLISVFCEDTGLDSELMSPISVSPFRSEIWIAGLRHRACERGRTHTLSITMNCLQSMVSLSDSNSEIPKSTRLEST